MLAPLPGAPRVGGWILLGHGEHLPPARGGFHTAPDTEPRGEVGQRGGQTSASSAGVNNCVPAVAAAVGRDAGLEDVKSALGWRGGGCCSRSRDAPGMWEQVFLRTLSAAAAETGALPHVLPLQPALSPTPSHLFLGMLQHRIELTQLIAPRTGSGGTSLAQDVPTFAVAALPWLCEAQGMSRAPTAGGGCLKGSAASLKQSSFRAVLVAPGGSRVHTSVSKLRASKLPDELENFKNILAIDTSLQ